MNFLAHLWLADQSSTSLAGAVLGDWLRGRVGISEIASDGNLHRRATGHGWPGRTEAPGTAGITLLPRDLAIGVLLHRRIDALTDAHPAVADARAHFASGERRYAGILLDIVIDHLLVRHWERFSDEALPDFTRRCARDVQAHAQWFERAGGPAPGATEFENLLLSYGSAHGVDRALQRTARRLRKPEGMLAAALRWPEHAARLEPRLADVLDDLAAAAQAFAHEAALAQAAS